MFGTDVSVVINLHREGRIAEATIESVKQAMRFAGKHGIKSELLCVLDRADEITKTTCEIFCEDAEILKTTFGDLSKARNFGVSKAAGQYTTFIDGDDLWGHRWIYESFREAENLRTEDIIIHPKMNLYFGRQMSPYYWVHPDMRREKIELVDIVAANRWTSLSFARTRTYRDHPYVENDIVNGFGYEDWLWHIETIRAGFIHIVPPQTIHFIRRKASGSLMEESNKRFVLPKISKVLDGARL